MGNSPTDLHRHEMLIFFLNHIVGPELAPPVQRGSSLPVLYHIIKYQRKLTIGASVIAPALQLT